MSKTEVVKKVQDKKSKKVAQEEMHVELGQVKGIMLKYRFVIQS